MSRPLFKATIIAAAAIFLAVFCLVVLPPVLVSGDVAGAFAAGFVNPYASGYSTDVLACWVILAAWIAYEARSLGIRHGWICALLGIIPGVAVGFALYLLLRMRQMNERPEA
ncbi:Protein of unknown function [Parasphingorhabdus marina DSM 22363]|uniref:DUF2834 domain-containing protein n=1 Tax=Parasphingorhabdus marina DSM 22363 TaxID=1123272 RepID=A0A1N6EMD5_9SPHN|nr:DUF2834 domain-containing protein [Parasphingorhabdus marina]SIN84127.1 Protein of unknown function [Parasphingorhabdus marina DSM 22363]